MVMRSPGSPPPPPPPVPSEHAFKSPLLTLLYFVCELAFLYKLSSLCFSAEYQLNLVSHNYYLFILSYFQPISSIQSLRQTQLIYYVYYFFMLQICKYMSVIIVH